MDHPLLQIKFHIPQLKQNLVSRPRLLELLNEGLGKKLIILSAPAGFGKSTLLAEWLRTMPGRNAWISLDEEDNDFARFLNYLVAALKELDPGIDNTALDLLHSPQPTFRSAAFTALINQIDEITTDVILVLDDYHLINNQEVHRSIEYLLNYQPRNFHLVISTRADPPFAYSLLRAQGDLLEIRMDQLKFTNQETKKFLLNELEAPFSDAIAAELTNRTEGWISGVQMASLSLRARKDPQEFVNSFSGSHKFILDYLFEEVFRQQPEQIQQFLLFTSILERMNGALCDEVIGTTNSQAILEKLERANLFLIPMDEERSWYRYHQLFKDLLTHRLSHEYPERVKSLYQTASRWCQQSDWPFLAIDYALEGCDYSRAVDLILEHAEGTLMRSEVITYKLWISKLPNEYLEGNHQIDFLNIWSQVLAGANFEKSLAKFEKSIRRPSSGRFDALKAFVQLSKGDFHTAGGLATEALERLDADDFYFRGLAAWIMGVFHALQQDLLGGIGMLEDLAGSLELEHQPMLRVMLLSQIAHAHSRLGNFSQSQRVYEQALQAAKDRQGNWIPIAGEALMGYGDLLREQNRLDQATDLILEGIELTQKWRKAAAIEGYLFLARVKQLQNNWVSANQALEKAMGLAIEYDIIDIDDRMVAMWQARLWCLEEKPLLVEEWVSRTKLDGEVAHFSRSGSFNLENYLLAREKIVLARYYLLTNRFEDALSLIGKLLKVFEVYGRLDVLIELFLLQSLVFNQIRRVDDALNSLEKALKLGEGGGFIGSFLENGPEIGELLRRFNQERQPSLFLDHLLETFSEDVHVALEPAKPMLDPLSERELDVLRFLPSNLTTPEIADEMMISINTVRTHIKNIYQKLGVHKRSEAVNRLHELDLL